MKLLLKKLYLRVTDLRHRWTRGVIPANWIPPVECSEFDRETIRIVAQYTMTSPSRIWALISSIHYIVNNEIKGDFCECGVWRGGSVLAIARTLSNLGITDRKIWLYDTFDGMTKAGYQDFEIATGKSAMEILNDTEVGDGNNVWAVSSVADVKNTLKLSSYPVENFVFVQGPVEYTLKYFSPNSISLLRLDTDWYSSTLKELHVLYPLITDLGVLIVDDYGHWSGAKQAVDEYFGNLPFKPFFHVIDYTGRLLLKPFQN
jgi:O-methyltransferase